MEIIVISCIVISIAICWIVAAIKFGKAGIFGHFFKHFVLCLVIIAALFMLLVFPVLDCTERWCGIVEILIFIILACLTFFVWGLVLLISAKSVIDNRVDANQPAISKSNKLQLKSDSEKYEEF